MSSATTYLITGANRGIGQGFVGHLLLRPGSTVISAVRDPSKAIIALEGLPTSGGSRLIVVKLDSTVHTDAFEAAGELRQKHGIDKVDVVIANAGIYHNNTSILNTDPDSLREHFEVNTLAPLALLQAFAPLLKESVAPKFVGISSLVGGLCLMKEMMEYGNVTSPYGASKAALNWIVQRVCLEEDWLTAFVFNPGLVITDMAKSFVGGADLEKIGGSTVDDSTESMLKIIDVATRDVHGGKFLQYNGQELPW
ncbi:aflatoxin biosynthesis ketoreductase nor-1 [Elsinoe ampelina]|uniref:Aflatoxin biosynthesis ketoreductase nor-1 n=1 Tax=Elsinoe ampelina TaxID=302913 RepID=A0A6A6GN54_9PEZI|nr:aflatoxin biosynthesis ketoreductase nor-1 [Elsinoe ampelina]